MIEKPQSLRRLFDAWEYIVDDRVGIIQFVAEVPREPGSPDFFHFFAQACNTAAFCGQTNFGNTGGASTHRGVAMAKAAGEAIERYCAAIYDVEDLPFHSYTNVPFRCVPPSDFALLSAGQYRTAEVSLVPFEEDTPVCWARAVDPLQGEVWHLPAAMVYIPYQYDLRRGENPIAQPISTGLACHCSYWEAAASAICEVIERDAFTITWQAMLTPPQIRLASLSAANRDRVSRFERAGYEVTLFNITMDTGVPTVLAVSRSRVPDAPPLVPAGAASLDPEQAVCKSLEELEHTRRYSQQILLDLPRLPEDPTYRNVRNQTAHLNFWCNRENAALADFLFASPLRIDFQEIADLSTGDTGLDLQALLKRVAHTGHRALLCEVTTPDVAEVGLSVVRAIIPGFHPLVVGHSIRSLGGKRLWTVPQRLGYKGTTPEEGDNPVPHPYP